MPAVHLADPYYRSVILDNMTLFTCFPLQSAGSRPDWHCEPWARAVADMAMHSLVEALVLHERVYFDGASRYISPGLNQIVERFPDLVRPLELDYKHEELFDELADLARRPTGVTSALSAASAAAALSPPPGLNAPDVDQFLAKEKHARQLKGYLPDFPVPAVAFRVWYYTALSAYRRQVYVPHPIRNRVVTALSRHPQLNPVPPGTDEYRNKVHQTLDYYDATARTGAFGGTVPMPSLWQWLKSRWPQGDSITWLVEEINKLRCLAAPLRQSVGDMVAAYASDDEGLAKNMEQCLSAAAEKWRTDLNEPSVLWDSFNIPTPLHALAAALAVRLATVPGQMWTEAVLTGAAVFDKIPVPKANPLKHGPYVFLHEWVTRTPVA